MLFHFDGEFSSMEQLVRETLTGRMQGWLPGEEAQATALIGKIIREDDGSGTLAQEFGGSYKKVLQGTDRSLPENLRLPAEFRVDATTASDAEILNAVAKLITVYVNDLKFAQDDAGAFSTSPYDRFLAANILPRTPDASESDAHYSRRLLREINNKSAFNFIRPGRGNAFQFHTGQDFSFGAAELRGLRLFLTLPQSTEISAAEIANGHIGNCAACHTVPAFTDFALHNNGAGQAEYEAVHGLGSFSTLLIPGLAARNAAPDSVLPATNVHPGYKGQFRSIAVAGRPELSDLGAWNVFANADFPLSQQALQKLLCRIELPAPSACPDSAVLLDRAVATFKTAGLGDLGHSAPYMHSGRFDSLEKVLDFYRDISARARAGQLRNADPRLKNIATSAEDARDIAAFLRALNEDYS